MVVGNTIIQTPCHERYVCNISLIMAYKMHFNVRSIVVARFSKSTVNAYACFI